MRALLMKLGGVVAVVALMAPGVPMAAQATQTLGSVSLPKKVMADGQPLPAGTYSLRLSSEVVKPVVGQPADSEKWVEFVQAGKVKGRELANVVAAAEVKQIAKLATPAPGTSKVQTLKGSDYIRVWINHGGTHYLLHLTPAV
jgi:hypothetical protein